MENLGNQIKQIKTEQKSQRKEAKRRLKIWKGIRMQRKKEEPSLSISEKLQQVKEYILGLPKELQEKFDQRRLDNLIKKANNESYACRMRFSIGAAFLGVGIAALATVFLHSRVNMLNSQDAALVIGAGIVYPICGAVGGVFVGNKLGKRFDKSEHEKALAIVRELEKLDVVEKDEWSGKYSKVIEKSEKVEKEKA